MKKENKIIIAIIIGALIISGGFIAKAKVTKDLADKKSINLYLSKSKAKNSYNKCMNVAFQDYSNTWDNQCKVVGKKEDCGLNASMSSVLDNQKNINEKTCLDIYKIELN